MKLATFVSYDGNTTLTNTSNYRFDYPKSGRHHMQTVVAADLQFVSVGQRQALVHSEPEKKYIEFMVNIVGRDTNDAYTSRGGTIKNIFDTSEYGRRLHTLIMQDDENTGGGASTKKWLMYCKPEIVEPRETGYLVVLGCNAPFWRGITRVQLNGALTATATTIAFDNDDTSSGTFPSYGWGWIDDGYLEEFITWTGKSASPAGNLTGVVRGVEFFDGRRGQAHAHADGKWIYSMQLSTITNPAHNATNTITPSGNVPTEPIVRIQPTGARDGSTAIADLGNLSRAFVEITNPNTTALTMGAFGWPTNIANAEAGNGLDTASLINDTTVSNQINNVAGIGTGDTTIDIDTAVGGGLPSEGMGYVDTEQIAWIGNSGSQLTGVVRGIGGTTAATHADNAVIARSKMLANGNDLQVKINGKLVDRWPQDINTASTEIWIRKDLPRTITATLGTAIGSSGAISSIAFAATAANYDAYQRIPTPGIVKIGSEYFTYTGKYLAGTGGGLTGIQRAAHSSAAAAHAVGVTITHIPLEVYLEFGKYTTVSPNTPNASDRQPMFDLTSENDRWDFTSMDTALGGRAAEWTPIGDLFDPPESNNPEATRFYTANRDTFADPAEEVGIRIKAWADGSRFRRTRFKGEWELALPVSMMDDVTITGEKYATSTAKWPTVQVRSGDRRDQMTAISDYTQTAPASDATWANWNNNSTQETFTAAKILQIYMQGEMPDDSSTQYQALAEATQIVVGMSGATVPSVSIGNINETAGGGADSTTTINPAPVLTNQTTGKKIKWAGSLAASEIIVLDTPRHKYYKFGDGSNQLSNFSTPDEQRMQDFILLPASNTILFEDQGTGNVTIDFFYFDRAI